MNETILEQDRESISRSLVKRRKELGMTQDELAAKSGMGIATIRRFETAKFWIGLKQLVILCRCLQCSIIIGKFETDKDEV